MGKPRVIAETGAGQHGVATATACALLGLDCEVYMGAEDVERQALNVFRMELLGAEVHAGRARLAHAQGRHQRGAARLGHERARHLLLHRLGDGPASVSDDRARLPARDRRSRRARRSSAAEGRLPDALVACVGGGSNAMGIFHPFLDDAGVRLIGVEAAGEGLATRPARRGARPRARRACCTA